MQMRLERIVVPITMALFALGGCAPLPGDLPPRPELHTPVVAQTAVPEQTRREGESRWWDAFGDDQLSRLIDEALAHNPSLAVADARRRAAQGLARQSALDAGAHYDSNASAQRARISEHGFLPPPFAGESYNLADVSLGITYSLDWWGRNRALVAAATSTARAAAAEQAAACVAIAVLVNDAYFALANAQEQEQMARQLVEKRRAALSIEKSRLARGLISPQPLREAEQSLARAEDSARRADYEMRAWRYRLATAVGRDPEQADALPPARLPVPLALPAALPLDWLARRPDVAAQRWRVQAAEDSSDAARAEFYPNVNLMLLVGLESRSASQLLTRGAGTGAFGAAVHIPAFNVNSLQTRLGTREAEYAAAVGEYNRTVLDAARQVADSYAALASLAQRAELQQRALKAAVEAEALSASRVRNGLSSRGESLGAEISALGQRQSEAETRAARLRATVALFQALGGGYQTSKE